MFQKGRWRTMENMFQNNSHPGARKTVKGAIIFPILWCRFYENDVQTLEPSTMVNDTIVNILLE